MSFPVANIEIGRKNSKNNEAYFQKPLTSHKWQNQCTVTSRPNWQLMSDDVIANHSGHTRQLKVTSHDQGSGSDAWLFSIHKTIDLHSQPFAQQLLYMLFGAKISTITQQYSWTMNAQSINNECRPVSLWCDWMYSQTMQASASAGWSTRWSFNMGVS